MTDLKQLRREMIIAMGSRCAKCHKLFDPDDLIIHHKGFEKGKRLGHQNPIRYKQYIEWKKTGVFPKDIELLCDDCNREKHKYRPSRHRIFGDRQ